jgi:hypothetical protein
MANCYPTSTTEQRSEKMARLLHKDDQGPEIKQGQTLLMKKGYLIDEEVNGDFHSETYREVLPFQLQNLDPEGQPLIVVGKVGELTWWSLHHTKPIIQTPSPVDFLQMFSVSMGGSKHGRTALQMAIDELKADAGKIGGNNRGPFVKKYLHGIVPEGHPWCAGIVSFCFSHIPAGMLFSNTVGARDVLRQFKNKAWTQV